MNYSSSDDSYVFEDARLSEISRLNRAGNNRRSISASREGTDTKISETVSIVHGAQDLLRNSIQTERMKRGALASSRREESIIQTPSRRPPAPPTSNKFYQSVANFAVDTTSIRTPENIGAARSHLTRLLQREKDIRNELDGGRPISSSSVSRRRSLSSSGRGINSIAVTWNDSKIVDTVVRRASVTATEINSLGGRDEQRNRKEEITRPVSREYVPIRGGFLDDAPDSTDVAISADIDVADRIQPPLKFEMRSVPVSSISIRSLMDLQRNALDAIRKATCDIRNVKSPEDISLIVGGLSSNSALKSIGLDKLSLWCVNFNKDTLQPEGLWTIDAHGLKSIPSALATENTESIQACWSRLDRFAVAGSRQQRTVIARSDSATSYLQCADTLQHLRQNRNDLNGTEISSKWSAIIMIDWSTTEVRTITPAKPNFFCGCLVAAYAKNQLYSLLEGVDEMCVNQLLDELSMVITARMTEISHSLDLALSASIAEKQLQCAQSYKQLLACLPLFDSAEDSQTICTMLSRTGISAHGQSLFSYALFNLSGSTYHKANENNRVRVFAANKSENGVTSEVNNNPGSVLNISNDSNSIHLAVRNARQGNPVFFKQSMSQLSAAGLLQFIDVSDIPAQREVTIAVIATNNSLGQEDLRYDSKSHEFRCVLVIVVDSLVVEEVENEMLCKLDNIARAARTSFERIERNALLKGAIRMEKISSTLMKGVAPYHPDMLSQVAAVESDFSEEISCGRIKFQNCSNLLATHNNICSIEFSQELHAETCDILYSDAFLALCGIQMKEFVSKEYGCNLMHMSNPSVTKDDVSLSPIYNNCSPVQSLSRSQTSWKNDIFSRKAVLVHSIYQGDPRRSTEDTSDLKKVIRAVNPEARSAILFPIFATADQSATSDELIAIFMITNKHCISSAVSNSTFDDGYDSLFVGKDVVDIEKSGILPYVSFALRTCINQDVLEFSCVNSSRRMKILSKSTDYFSEQTIRLKKEYVLKQTFRSWKFAVKTLKSLKTIDSTSQIVSRYHKAVAGLILIISDRARSVEQVMKVLEQQLMFIFPQSNILVESISPLDEYFLTKTSKSELTAIDDEKALRERTSFYHRRDNMDELSCVICTSLNITGEFISEDFIKRLIQQTDRSEKLYSNNNNSGLAFKIRLAKQESFRLAGSTSRFSDIEEDIFCRFCDYASTAFSAMCTQSLQLSVDIVRTTKHLITPRKHINDDMVIFLSHLVPLLLDRCFSTTVESSSLSKEDLYCAVTMWLKTISNSDIALLRLRSFEEGVADSIISSEDRGADLLSRLIHADTKSILKRFSDSSKSRLSSSGMSLHNLAITDKTVFQLLDGTSDPQSIGEIQLLCSSSKSTSLLETENEGYELIMSLVSYLFSVSVILPERMNAMKELYDAVRSKLSGIQTEFEELFRNFNLEKATTESLRNRLSCVLSLLLLNSRIIHSVTLQSLDSLLSEALRDILGAKAVVLLLPPDRIMQCDSTQTYGDEVADSDLVSIIASKDGNANVHTTWRHVRQFPIYGSKSASSQQYLPLILPNQLKTASEHLNSNISFGALLIIADPGSGSPSVWAGLEEFLTMTLSSSVYAAISKLEQLRKEAESSKLVNIQSENSRLSSLLKDSDAQKETFISQLFQAQDKLENELSRSKQIEEEQELMRRQIIQKDDTIKKLNNDLKSAADSEKQLQQMLKTCSEISLVAAGDKELLLCASRFANLCGGFMEVVQSSSSTLSLLRVENGKSREILTKQHNNTDDSTMDATDSAILSAAKDSIKMNKAIEIKLGSDKYYGSIVGVHSVGQNARTVTARDDKNRSILPLNILCIPNPRYSVKHDVLCTTACLIFVRYDKIELLENEKEVSSEFSDSERSLLLFISSIYYQCLYNESVMKAEMEGLAGNIHKLEISQKQSKVNQSLIAMIIEAFSEIWFNHPKTLRELSHMVSDKVEFLLGDSEISITCSLYFASSTGKTYKTMEGSKNTSEENEIIRQVCRTKKYVSSGIALWYPVVRRNKDPEINDILAILRVEKRFTREIKSSPAALISLTKLTFSEEESMALNSLSVMLIPCFDRIQLISSAYSGVHQASLALESLQHVQDNLQDQLSIEISTKMAFNDTLKASTNLLMTCLQKSCTEVELHEFVTKSVTQVISADACYILYPKTRAASDTIAGCVEGENYIYIEPNLYHPKEIALIEGDIELITLKTNRSISLQSSATSENWASKSWAVRQYANRINSDVQSQALSGLFPEEVKDTEVGTNSISTNVITIPYFISEGFLVCIVAVRNKFPFGSQDRDCIMHLLRTVSCCLRLEKNELKVQELQSSHDRFFADSNLRKTQSDELLSESIKEIVNDLSLSINETDHLLRLPDLRNNITSLESDSGNFVELDVYSNIKASISTLCRIVFSRDIKSDIQSISNIEYHVKSQAKLPPRITESNPEPISSLDPFSTNSGTLSFSSVFSNFWINSYFDDQKSDSNILTDVVLLMYSKEWVEKAIYLRIRQSFHVHSGEDITWRYNTIILPLIKVRLVFLIRLITFLENSILFRNVAVSDTATHYAGQIGNLEHKIKELVQLNESVTTDKDSFVMVLKEKHDASIHLMKDKYKSIFLDKSRSHKMSELFLKKVVAIIFNASKQYLTLSRTEDKKIAEYLRSKSAQSSSMILRTLRKIADDLCHISDFDLSVDIYFHKEVDIGDNNLKRKSSETPELLFTWVDNTNTKMKHKSSHPALPEISTSKKAIFSSTHPIYLAKSLNSYVLVPSESDDQNEVHDIDTSQKQSENIPIILCRTEEYPARTLFVPISCSFEQTIVTFVVVIASKILQKEGKTDPWIIPLRSLVFCWNYVRDMCHSISRHHDTIMGERIHFVDDGKKKATITFSITIRKLIYSRLKRAFFTWKLCAQLDDNISIVCLRYEEKLRAYSIRVKYLEKEVADWAETVKSANGVAAGQLMQGLKGVWSQACVPFMTLMSSSVEVVGCGLLVSNHMDEILELCVRRGDGVGYLDTASPDNDVIEVRPASELGAGVLSLTWSIINGTMEARNIAQKRLWKLNKQETLGLISNDSSGQHNNSNSIEQMWLVPIRTAWAVLGVLRLSIRYVNDPVIKNVGNVDLIRTLKGENAGFQDRQSGDVDFEEPLEQSKRNMINFAEVIAPVILAARQVDVAKSREQDLVAILEENKLRAQAASTEAHSALLSIKILSSMFSSISNSLEINSLREIEEFMFHRKSDIDSISQKAIISNPINAVKTDLETLLASALGHEVSITFYFDLEKRDSDDIKIEHIFANCNDEENLGLDTTFHFSERIKNTFGQVIGVIRVKLNDSWGPAMPQVSAILPTENKIFSSEESYLKDQIDFTHIDKINHNNAEISSIKSALPIASLLISTMVAFSVRKSKSHQAFFKFEKNIHSLKDEICDQQCQIQDSLKLVNSCKESLTRSMLYRDILSRCLSVNASISKIGSNDLVIDNEDPVDKEELTSTNELNSEVNASSTWNCAIAMFNDLSNKLNEALQGQCVFRFGMIAIDQSHALLDNGQLLRGEDISFQWYYGDTYAIDRQLLPQGEIFMPCGINIGINGTRICANLATSCTLSSCKSVVHMPEAEALTVYSYPIRLKSRLDTVGPCIGVLQMFVPLGGIDSTNGDALCEEITSAVSYAAVNVKFVSRLHYQLDSISKISVGIRQTAEEFEYCSNLWKLRANSWKNINTLSEYLVRDISTGKTLFQSLFSEEVQKYLIEAGVSVTKSGDSLVGSSLALPDNQYRNHQGLKVQSVANLTLHLPPDKMFYGDSTPDVLIEISCLSNTLFAYRSNKVTGDKYAEEIVNTVGALIQSLEILIKFNNNALKEVNSLYSSANAKATQFEQAIQLLQHENNMLGLHQKSAINKMEHYIARDAKTQKFSASLFENLLLPITRESAGLLTTLLSHYESLTDTIDANSGINFDLRAAQTLDKAYSGIALLGDKTISRFVTLLQLNHSEKHGDENSINIANTGREFYSSQNLSDGPILYNISVVVRRDRKHNKSDIKPNPKYAVYDGATGGHRVISDSEISTAFNSDHGMQRPHQSALEKCFKEGSAEFVDINLSDLSIGDNVSQIDLLGIDSNIVASITGKYNPLLNRLSKDHQLRFRIFCVTLAESNRSVEMGSRTGSYRTPAALRCVWLEVIKIDYSSSQLSSNGSDRAETISSQGFEDKRYNFINDLVELISSNTSSILKCITEVADVDNRRHKAEKEKSFAEESMVKLEDLLSRNKRIYKLVARESNIFLDPPVSHLMKSAAGTTAFETVVELGSEASSDDQDRGVTKSRTLHPAHLSPISATEDVCLKMLGLLRSLLRTEGQSVLLADIDTIPTSYQVLYTGDALYWSGTPHGSFGRINSSESAQSLVESTIKTHRPICVSDLQNDPRYFSQLDGGCAPLTPGLFLPLRGRGGVIIGVVIVARAGNGSEFSQEDVTAAEMILNMAGLSLYWCRGLGAVHLNLEKKTNRLNKLENVQYKSKKLK